MNDAIKHPVFNDRYKQFLQDAREMRLGIIILGPGEGSAGYEKRKQLKDHLSTVSSGRYDVAFIEDLLPVDTGRPTNDPMETIAFHIANANVVLALAVDDRSVTGVLTEIDRFRSDRAFLEKTFVVVPENFGRKKRKTQLPLIWQSVRVFPAEQRFNYTPQQFEDCRVMRDWIAEKAAASGRKVRYKEFLRERGISPPNPF